MNSFGTLHPALVHFPIGLLAVVPVLILVGVFSGSLRRGVMLATAIVLLVGTIASYVAVAAGESSGDVAIMPPDAPAGLNQAIHNHEELAETCRNIFTALTVLYGLLVFTPPGLKWLAKPKWTLITQLIFLVLHSGAVLLLLRVGHLGGRLVHHWGIHVPL